MQPSQCRVRLTRVHFRGQATIAGRLCLASRPTRVTLLVRATNLVRVVRALRLRPVILGLQSLIQSCRAVLEAFALESWKIT